MTAFLLALNALQIHSAKPWFNQMHLQPCFYIFIFAKGLPGNIGQSLIKNRYYQQKNYFFIGHMVNGQKQHMDWSLKTGTKVEC